ncbi:MAG TPA: LarC family nickel insertion protein [Burkholderiales bacterium]|nr:LarC family nickel insertion protein [Burkholderiales bacterium]
MHLHLDAIGGVAGDMFIAAVLDAFPHLRDGMLQAIRTGGLPEDIVCRTVEHRDDILTGLRFLVEAPAYRPHDRGLALPEERHRHTPFREIRTRLERSTLAPGVKQRAIHIFTLLAEVEGKVHGMPAEAVSFHELGGWDSIADMVGAAFLIDALDPATWSVGPLPQGSGRVRTDHGWLPIPTPATALLLQGFELIDDGLPGERVTPTGAAILKHLDAAQKNAAQHDRQPRRLLHTGSGFGTRTLPGLSNVLRVLSFEEAAERSGSQRVAHIAFEVDDQTPEDLAIALDRLRAHPSVLDVLQMPAFGKKGRVTAHIQILVEPEDLNSVFEACFRETATLGLRWQIQGRRILRRTQATVDIDGRSVRVKVADRPGAPTAKAESDDLLSVKGGRQERESLRQAAEQAGLDSENK